MYIKKVVIAVLMSALLAFPVLAQTTVTTPRLAFTQLYTPVGVKVVNSTDIQATLQQPIFPTGSCVQTPIATKPYVYPSSDLPTLFDTNMAKYMYPQNVLISKLRIRFCYHRSGTLANEVFLAPVFQAGGLIYEPSSGAIAVPAGTYSDTQATLSPEIVWDFSGFPVQSAEIALNMYQIGLRVRPIGDNTALHINGMDLRVEFEPTAPESVTLTSPLGTSLGSGTVKVSQSASIPPSNAQGIQLRARCANGTYGNLAVLPWGGQVAGSYIRTYNVSALNSSACASSPLSLGGTTVFQTQPLSRSGVPIGSVYHTSTLSL